MGTAVPIDLLRLRSATAAYVAVLYDSLQRLEHLTAPDTGPAPHDAELMARLRDSIEAALDIEDAPGTPAAILTTLCHLLGVGPLAAGVSAPWCPPSASEMQVHLYDGIVDDRDDEALICGGCATWPDPRRLKDGQHEQKRSTQCPAPSVGRLASETATRK